MNTKVLEVNVDDLNMGGVFSLVKNVILNRDPDIQIDIAAIERFANVEHKRMFQKLGTEVYDIGYDGNKWKKQLVCYWRLKKLLKTEDYDAVHIHGDVANKLLVSGLAAKHGKVKKIILHSHASGVDGNHRAMKILIHKLCRNLLKNVGSEYVACSDLAAEWMFPHIKKEQIVIVNNGVDLDRFRFCEEIREIQRKKLGAENQLLIGHVGRFCYQKNHDYLLAVISEVKKRGIKAKFLLVGEGPEEERIKRKVKEEDLGEYVIFYGVSDQIQELFQAMDIFVLPSHFEGLPIVGVEAQAAGLPVIFSDKITREARLTENVAYLGIEQENLTEWADRIQEFAAADIRREKTYYELKKRKFRVRDTAESFFALYRDVN